METHVSHSQLFFPLANIPIDTFHARRENKLTLRQMSEQQSAAIASLHDNEHDGNFAVKIVCR